MLKEIYTAALGMLPQQTRLELTANNIANANATGYKRLAVFEQTLIEARQALLHNRAEIDQADPPLDQYTDFTPGPLQNTGNTLDVSLATDGFFVLHDTDGNESFTRSGHFTIDDDGIVVSDSGKALQSDKGTLVIDSARASSRALQNDRKAVDIRITPAGEVYANDQFLARIAVVQVANPQSLLRTTGMEFSPTETTDYSFKRAEEIAIKQGFLEGSNVNIVTEMIAMIQLQKAFEMGQKVITSNDSTLEKSIDIGRMGG